MKKLLSIVLSLVMLCAVFIAPIEAKAHVHEELTTSSITPYAQICGNCDSGILFQSKVFGSWVRTGSRINCSHGYGYGQDLEESKSVTITLKCNNCGIGTTYLGTPETRWICYGFN